MNLPHPLEEKAETSWPRSSFYVHPTYVEIYGTWKQNSNMFSQARYSLALEVRLPDVNLYRK